MSHSRRMNRIRKAFSKRAKRAGGRRRNRKPQLEALEIRTLLTQLGPEFRANFNTSGDQHTADVASDSSGNFVFAWEGSNINGFGTDDVYVRRFNSLGTPLGTDIRVHDDWPGDQEDPEVAVAPDGKFVVAYESPDADGTGIYVRRFDATGAAQGAPALVNTTTTGDQINPSIDIDDNGNFLVAWQGTDADNTGIFAQRFDASGNVVGGEVAVNTTTTDRQEGPAVAMDADGDAIITWHSANQDGSSWGVYGQRYTSAGATAGAEFLINTETSNEQSNPSVDMASGGSFVVAWLGAGGQDGSSNGVFAQRFNADGSNDGTEFQVNTTTSGAQDFPHVTGASDGSFLISWEGADSSGHGVFYQRYDAVGDAIGIETQSNTTTSSDQLGASGAYGSGDRFLVAWQSQSQDGSGWGVYAQLEGTGLAQPDLVPIRTTAPKGLNQGDQFSPTVTFRNQGNVDSGDYVAQYYLSLDPVITAADTPVGAQIAMSSLAAMTTATDSRLLTVPADLTPTVYYLGMLFDVNDDVGEADETNNGTATEAFATISVAASSPGLGNEFILNSYTPNEQDEVEVAYDPTTNNYVAVWHGPNHNGYGTNDVFFQRFNSEATPLGFETQVHDDWKGEQVSPDLAISPADGSFAIAYESPDEAGIGIYVRRFGADGNALGAPTRVNTVTANDQVNPAIAMDDTGKFVVTWMSWEQDGDDWGVYGQRFNADGTKAGTEFRANTFTTSGQEQPAVAMDADGDFVITWHSWNQDGSGWGIYGQRYQADGTPAGSEFRVNTFTSSYQTWPSVDMDAAGNFIVAWQSYQFSSQDIIAQRFNADGSRAGGEFLVNTSLPSDQVSAEVNIDDDGSFLIAWADGGGQDGSGWGVFAQKFTPTGEFDGGEFQLNSTTSSTQDDVSVALGMDDDFFAAWHHWHDGSSFGIAGQLFGQGLDQPDLVPLRTTAPLGLHPGDQFTATAWIRNQGDATAGAFSARYYLSTDAIITSDDTPLGGAFPIDGLNPLANHSDSRTLDIPSSQAPGTYFVGVLADVGEAVNEADNEGNNGTATQGFAQVVISDSPAKLGNQFGVNRSIAGRQENIELGGNGNNQFIAVWHGPNQLGYGTTDVFFQRLNEFGTPLGPETTVHHTWPGEQVDPAVAVAVDGSFIVVYESADADGFGVYHRRFDANGAPLGDPILVNTETNKDQTNVDITIDASGNYIITWQSLDQDGNSWGVFGQRYTADGGKAGSEFQVNTRTSDQQSDPRIASDDTGNFVIIWQSLNQDGSNWGVYGQRYNANGTINGGEFQVNTFTNSNQVAADVAMDADGDFVVTWRSVQFDGYDIIGQRFNSDGTRAGGEFLVNTTTTSTQEAPVVAIDSAGNFMIGWTDQSGKDSSGAGVYGQRYDATGTVIGGEFKLHTMTSSTQDTAALTFGDGGRWMSAWRHWSDGSDYGIQGQMYGDSLAQADLVPLLTTAPAGANRNSIITVSSEIRNQGSATSQSFTARYYISDDAVITADDLPLGNPFTIDGIAALTTITNASEVQVPLDAPLGTRYVGLLLDIDDKVTEVDETNNGQAADAFPQISIADPEPALGAEFQINTSTSGIQTAEAVGADGDGNYVVVWQGVNKEGFDTNEIYMQRFNSLGTPIGFETQVNADWQGEQSRPDLTVAPDGSFVVAWDSDRGADTDQTGIYARRFDSDGNPLGDEFLVNTFTTNRQEGPAIASDDNGNFTIAWHSLDQDGSNWGVYAQRFDASGAKIDTEFRVSSTSANEQSTADIAIDPDGDTVIVWQSRYQDGSEYGIFGQRYDSGGTPQGAEFQLNSFTSSHQFNPSVAMDDAGDFTAVWQSWEQLDSGYGIYGQRYNANGSKAGDEFHVNTYTTNYQELPSIAIDGAGNSVVTWESASQDGSSEGVYVQRYDSSGNALGGEFRANTQTSNDQSRPYVTYGNSFLVIWSSRFQDGSDWGVYGQLYATGVADADLVPTGAFTSSGANLNQAMQVSGTIRNQGLTDSGMFTAQYYASDDATITTADVPIGDAFDIANLAAMTTMTDSRWVPAPSIAAGDYYIGLIVDTGGDVAEDDETNNTTTMTAGTFNLQALPDLGPELRVNSTTINDQNRPKTAFDASGNYVVVWESDSQDGDRWGVYGQRFDSNGNEVGSEFRVNTTTDGDQRTPSLAVAPDGSFVVAWQSQNQDGSGWGVYAQRYDSNGDTVGGEFLVNTRTTQDQDTPSVAMDADGNFLIVWHDVGQDSGSNGGIYGQMFNADGTANGSEFWVASSGSPNQQWPTAAMNANGEFVVAWDDGNTVWARAFEADGTARGDEIEVHDFDSSQQARPGVAIDSSGNFVVTWHSLNADGSSWAVRARRFDVDGNSLGSEFNVNTHTPNEQSWPKVAMNAAGDFMIVWHSRHQDGSEYGVFGQRFQADGTPYGGEFQLNVFTNSNQYYPAVDYRGPNDFIAVWESWQQDGSRYGIYSQRAGISSENSLPNLTITKNSVPFNILLNDTVGVELNVQNTGFTIASPTTLKLFLSDDNTAGNEDDIDLNTSVSVPRLLNGANDSSFAATASFTWPANDPFGTDRNYFVVAVADADAEVAEANEEDNVSVSNSLHLQMADLRMTQLSVPSQIEPGQQVEATITIRNEGDATAPASIAHLWLSDDNIAGNEDDIDLLIDVAVPELAPYRCCDFVQFTTTVQFQWPVDDPFGTDRSYYLVSNVDITDQVVESDEGDNSRVSNSMFVIMPNLIVNSVNGPSQVRPGDEVTYDVRIRNVGENDAPASKLRVFLSDDSVGGNGDDFDLEITADIPALEPYQCCSFVQHVENITFTWPATDPFGTDLLYYVTVQIDADAEVKESNEDDNRGTSSQIQLLVPDLTIDETIVPSTVSAGLDVIALVEIRNAGGEATGESTNGRVFLSDNDIAGDDDDIDLGVTFEIPDLLGGAFLEHFIDIPLPVDDPIATDGEYYFVFTVDANDAIAEGKEDNNTFVSESVAWVVPLDLEVDQVGHLGGASYAVGTSPNAGGLLRDGEAAYAYELTSAGLRVLDITDPGRITRVGELLFPVSPFGPGGPKAEVIVDGTTLLVVDGQTLRVIDVSSPTLPMQLASRSLGDIAGVHFDAGANLLYMGQEMDLIISDYSTPTSPSEVGRISFPGMVLDLAIGDDVAYVLYSDFASSSTALETIDISNPASPTFVGRRFFNNNPMHLTVKDDVLAFVTVGSQVRLFDISDAKTPRARGVAEAGGGVADLAFHGNDLVAVTFNSVGASLELFDAADPFDPFRVSAQQLFTRQLSAFSTPASLDVGGSRIFVSAQDLAAVDVSNRFEPELIGQFGEPYGLSLIGVGNNLATVVQSSFNGTIADLIGVSQPSTPILRGSAVIEDQVQDVLVDGSLAVARPSFCFSVFCFLSIWDLSNPNAPQEASTLNAPGLVDMALDGEMLFLLRNFFDSEQGRNRYVLEIYSLAAPDNPVLAGATDLSPNFQGNLPGLLSVSGGRAFVTNATAPPSTDGQVAEEANDFDNPMHLGTFPNVAPVAGEVGSSGEDYFAFDGEVGQVVSVSLLGAELGVGTFTSGYFSVYDPDGFSIVFECCSAPFNREVTLPKTGTYKVEVGNFSSSSQTYMLAITPPVTPGNVAIVDVTSTAQPRTIGDLLIDRPVTDMTANGHLFFSLDEPPMLQAWDVSDPSNPVPQGTAQLAEPGELSLGGNLIYVNTSQGIQFIDVFNPSRPVTLETFETPHPISDLVVDGSLIHVVSDTFFTFSVRPAGEPAPDLAVTSTTVPRAIQAGLEGTVQWTVRNLGQQVAPGGSWNDNVYLSANARLDAGDTLLGTVRHTDALDPLASYSESLTFSTAAIAAGSYFIIVHTDADDEVNELFVESNNIRVSRSFTVAKPDLAVTNISNPVTIDKGDAFTISWIVQNRGLAPANDLSWMDSVYLTTTGVLDGNEISVGKLEHTGGLDIEKTYHASLVVDTSGLADGTYFVHVKADGDEAVDEDGLAANNLRRATRQTSLGTPELTLGEALTESLSGVGAEKYFRVDVEAGQHLFVTLDDLDDSGHNELYVKYGTAPTRSDYDARYGRNLAADQQLELPDTLGGTYYILVYGDMVSGGENEFNLTATILDFSILGVSPTHAGNAGSITLSIRGANFPSDATAILTSPTSVEHSAVNFYNLGTDTVYATFDLIGAEVGLYDVSIETAGANTSVDDFLDVVNGSGANFSLDVSVPSIFRVGTPLTAWLNYANTGDADLSVPIIGVSTSNGGLRLQDSESDAYTPSVEILAINPYGGPAGILPPGTSVSIPLTFLSNEVGDVDFASYFHFGSDQPLDIGVAEETRPGGISSEAWNVIWNNYRDGIGTTFADYVNTLRDNATYLSLIEMPTRDIQVLNEFELRQAYGNFTTVSALAQSTDAAVQSPGLPLSLQRVYGSSVLARLQESDFGWGWSHSWDISLQVSGAEVTVTGIGTRRFIADGQGGYTSAPGESAQLTRRNDGSFDLQERDGRLYSFDPDGSLSYVEDTNGNRITTGYTDGNLTLLTHSSGQFLAISYNASGRIAGLVDSVGRTTTFTYDASGNYLEEASYFDGTSTVYTYNTTTGGADARALTSIEYANGAVTQFTYDSAGRLASTSGNNGQLETSYTYGTAADAFIADTFGNSTSTYFDLSGNIAWTKNPVGAISRMQYDDVGHLTRIIDPTGASFAFTYDSNGNLALTTNPLGDVNRFQYDAQLNRLTTYTDALGNTTQYNYDGSGNRTSTSYADGSVESWTYDALGNPITRTNRRGDTTEFSYGSDGRTTFKTFSDGSDVALTYNTWSSVTETVDDSGTTNYTYDSAGRLTRIDFPEDRFLIYAYDSAGQRISNEDQAGNVTKYSYDSLGRLESVTDGSDNSIANFSFDTAGRPVREDLGNGVYSTYEYNEASQLTHLANFAPDDSVISRFDYTYDPAGRRTSMAMLDGTWTYTYDAVGQLTRAILASTNSDVSDQDLQFEYDAAGNRIRTVANGVLTTYSTTELNQYAQVGDSTYEYDADGNLISVVSPTSTTTYDYDSENRLKTVSSDGDSWNYVYDAFGRRTAATAGGVTTHYVVDPRGLGNVVGEYDEAGNTIANYVYGDGLVSRVAGSVPAYYTTDALGTVSELTDAAGVPTNTYEYDPFGNVLHSSGSVGNSFEFTGELGSIAESNGLTYMRARYYEPTTGSFLSVDPLDIPGAGHVYVGSDPISFVDPSGFVRWGDAFWSGVGIVGSGIGVAVGVVTAPTGVGAAVAVGSAYGLGVNTGNLINALTDTEKTLSGGLLEDIGKGVDALAGNKHGEAQKLGSIGDILTPGGNLGGKIDKIADATKVAGLGKKTYDSGKEIVDEFNPNDGGGGDGGGGDGGGGDGGGGDGGGGDGGGGDGGGGDGGGGDGGGGDGGGGDGGGGDGGGGDGGGGDGGGGDGGGGDGGGGDGGGGDGGGGGGGGGGSGGGGSSSGRRSFDPNDKVGRKGFGEQNYIVPGKLMPFTIYYENDPKFATLAAQNVLVEDQLNPSFDWSTFELGDINLFGDFVVDVPEGLNFYQDVVDIRPEGIDLLVRITAGINGETGKAEWLFESLDPETLDIPQDPLAGFLAVNDKETHIGEGKLDYFIRTHADLASGVSMTNQAFNTFDQNEPVATPITLHTIDNALPASSVNVLPATVPDDPLLVSWSGQDEENGSGIASYTIFSRQDGGPWKVWLRDTTQTSALFNGIGGHRYEFYSVATDNVGHEEPPKTAPDAGTDMDFSQLRVSLIETIQSGFSIRFRRPIDPSALNLYRVENLSGSSKSGKADSTGTADITVVGDTVGAVGGSIVYDDGTNTLRFVKTGGPLEPDTYTLTLRSADDGFKDAEGNLLDGDGDDAAGGDFVQTIVVPESTAPVVRLGDMTSGPGEVIDLTGQGLGVPLVISNGDGVEALDVTFTYDPKQLSFSDIQIGDALPQGSVVQANFTVPGIVALAIITPTALPAGEVTLATLTAAVPSDAVYGMTHVIDITNVLVNEGGIAAASDDALHTAAVFGDTTGNGSISSLDAQRALRVATGLDTGFAAFPMIDPVLLADLTRNGSLSSLDAVRILQIAVGLPPQVQQSPSLVGEGESTAPVSNTAAGLVNIVDVQAPTSSSTVSGVLNGAVVHRTFDDDSTNSSLAPSSAVRSGADDLVAHSARVDAVFANAADPFETDDDEFGLIDDLADESAFGQDIVDEFFASNRASD